ncbi:hypothetical protein BKM20_28355 [Pseudomonas avellanae]|uniref:Uncharacterized protein n=1 Tax=Pseudomonas avellanae pv. morsprunorum TaxID=3380385 RepID=A0ABX4YPN3_9PSED|nr:hypothetical protein AL055_11780 [Pseudomonas amygdali pv. morsprunorum]PHN41195.1 hypothetical protein AO261_10895 [Pseudomonas avellanae]POC81758.1 hypothetical protein BKM26_28340 [Pseudomonas avellanae]POC98756.1 hypothetical protein BKM20_28355 [Pseudomonas avellanae]POD20430.1 hypothetical protein BKM05_19175 [Pseudomonas avellanae]
MKNCLDGIWVDRNLPIGLGGAFLPSSRKAGKGQFRDRSSLAGVNHEFDHSCAIDPDKRCDSAFWIALGKAEAVALPINYFHPITVAIQKNKKHGIEPGEFDVQLNVVV